MSAARERYLLWRDTASEVAELSALGLAAAVVAYVGLWQASDAVRSAALASSFTALLVVLAIVDLRTSLLPDRLTLPGLVCALLVTPLWPGHAFWTTLLAVVVVTLAAFALFRLLGRLVGRMVLGDGDYKLLALIVAAIGFNDLFAALVITMASSMLASIIVLLHGLRMKKIPYYMPYGPYLSLGGVVMLWA